MDFKTKIDKIVKARKLARWKLAEEAGLESTLQKAYKENREMRETSTGKLLEALGISQIWWDTGQGEIFISPPHHGSSGNNGSSYNVPPATDQWVHKSAHEALQANLEDIKARLSEAQETINELNRLHAQHNEQMKLMLELAKEIQRKAGK